MSEIEPEIASSALDFHRSSMAVVSPSAVDTLA